MAYVIAEPCVSTCDTACVQACPVDAIHGPIDLEALARADPARREELISNQQLFIDPETCICCAACEPVCPAGAIFEEDALPPQWKRFKDLNAAYFERP